MSCPICHDTFTVAIAGPDENGMYDTDDCPCQLRPSERPMPLPVTDRRATVPAYPSLDTAGADVAEADTAQAVAADPSVIDAERHPSYSHGVEHATQFSPADSASRKGRSRGDAVATSAVTQRPEARIGQERAVLPQKPGTAARVAHRAPQASGDSGESLRLGRLSRWQEQR